MKTELAKRNLRRRRQGFGAIMAEAAVVMPVLTAFFGMMTYDYKVISNSAGSVGLGGTLAKTTEVAQGGFNLNFTGNGRSGQVSNRGTISVGSGGYAALLGGSVSNSGTITVPLGRVGLASGESVAALLRSGVKRSVS